MTGGQRLDAEVRDDARRGLAVVQQILADYIVVGEAERTFLSVWCVHTYLLDYVRVTPYVAILSPTMRSGKTRLLEILELLTCRGWLISDVTPATVFRKVSDERVTLLLDEADCQHLGSQLRSLLNTGYKSTGRTVRLNRKQEAVEYSTFCAKAFAGIGAPLPATVMDRSIPVVVKRKLPSEPILPFRVRDIEVAASQTQAAFHVFAHVFGQRIATADPAMPEGLSDRKRESLESLFAIADVLRCRSAFSKAVKGVLSHELDFPDPGVALLNDVREAYAELGVPRAGTDVLLAAMRDLVNPTYHGEATRGPMALALALRPFGIVPRQLWIGGRNVKGYERSGFEDAWERYCR